MSEEEKGSEDPFWKIINEHQKGISKLSEAGSWPPEIAAAKIQAEESLRNFFLERLLSERNFIYRRIQEGELHSFDATIQHGLSALRTVTIVNAAAIAGLLGVLPNLRSPTGDAITFQEIRWTVVLYFLGFLFGAFATGFAYFAQQFYTYATAAYQITWAWPYATEHKGRGRAALWGHIITGISIVLVVSSYVFLTWGSLKLYWVLTW
ncbi:hypothetical protein [Cohaesibacter marisflavi]|uniref:hypothetical protein n=1 Tax=Cohaesibacter marisflavi TaxID=655353 RepID=UPI0029C89FDF|nr:hypothetical protein [Cohaesibacter marisflavi]